MWRAPISQSLMKKVHNTVIGQLNVHSTVHRDHIITQLAWVASKAVWHAQLAMAMEKLSNHCCSVHACRIT
jgi:hypothetical protein